MTWIRIDDDMLDHPKWRRAIKLGGDGVVAMWVRLTSYCSRRLTDGHIPAELVEQVAEVGRSKQRARQLEALYQCELVTRPSHDRAEDEPRPSLGRATIVDYLERNPAAAEVRARRVRRAESQKNRRLNENEAGHAETSDASLKPASESLPARPGPSRSHPDPGSDPAAAKDLTGQSANGPARSLLPPVANPEQPVWTALGDWQPGEEDFAAAMMAGVPRDYFLERIERLRNSPIGGKFGTFDRGKFVRGLLPQWARDRATDNWRPARAAGRSGDVLAMLADRRAQHLADEASEDGKRGVK